MSNISILSPTAASEASEQTNSLENGCSQTDMQATDATNIETRLAAALLRRERDVLLRANPRTIEHIRQLIALECTRVERTPTAGGAA